MKFSSPSMPSVDSSGLLYKRSEPRLNSNSIPAGIEELQITPLGGVIKWAKINMVLIVARDIISENLSRGNGTTAGTRTKSS